MLLYHLGWAQIYRSGIDNLNHYIMAGPLHVLIALELPVST